MPPSLSHLPVAVAAGRGGDADDRLVERLAAFGAVELGVAEAEDAAVGGHLPVALAVGVAAMPTIGALSGLPPSEPKKPAPPKAKIPPSLATSQ